MNIKKTYKKYIKKKFHYISYLDDDGNGVELDINKKKIIFHENNNSEDKIKLQFLRSLKCYNFYDIAKEILKMALKKIWRNEFYFYICTKKGNWDLLDKLRRKDQNEIDEYNN